MRLSLLLNLIVCSQLLFGQIVINRHSVWEEGGEVVLAEGIAIPKVEPGYTLWLPKVESIKGLVVFTHARRELKESDELIDYALSQNLAVVYVTTDNRLEFFFKQERLLEVECFLKEILDKHDIPESNMLYCGMSLEGTRALKLAIYGHSWKALHHLKPRAIAICDAPLDMVRFHHQMVRAKELAFTPITENEGTWVSGYLESNLGGTPADSLDAYIQYSPYCYSANGGPHLAAFDSIAIRAYTEPDVQWWMDNRGKDYYAMNAIDLAAFINDLNLRGHKEATLITTRDKGYLPDGSRHPHTWGIVDEKELIDWFVSLLDN